MERQRSVSEILLELQSYIDERDREVDALRGKLERLTKERDDLAGQLLFAVDQANRETRNASSLRTQLLSRTTVPHERLDFCCDDEHGETTAVLPKPRFVPRRRREDDTLVTRNS